MLLDELNPLFGFFMICTIPRNSHHQLLPEPCAQPPAQALSYNFFPKQSRSNFPADPERPSWLDFISAVLWCKLLIPEDDIVKVSMASKLQIIYVNFTLQVDASMGWDTSLFPTSKFLPPHPSLLVLPRHLRLGCCQIHAFNFCRIRQKSVVLRTVAHI